MSFASVLEVPLGPEPDVNSEVGSEEDVGANLEAAAVKLRNPSARRQRDRTRRTPTDSPPSGGYKRKKTDWDKVKEQGRKQQEEWEKQHPGEHLPFALGGNKNDWRISTNEFLENRKRQAEERYQRTKELEEKGTTEESPFAHILRDAAEDISGVRRSARIRDLKERKTEAQEVKIVYAPRPRKQFKRSATKPQGVQKKKAPRKSSTTKTKQSFKDTKKISKAQLEDAAPQITTVSADRAIDDTLAETAVPKGRRTTKSQQSKGKSKGVHEKMSQSSNVKPKGLQKKKSSSNASRAKRKGP